MSLIDSYPSSNITVGGKLYHGGYIAFGQSFTGNGKALHKVSFLLGYKTGSPTGNVYAKLYAHSGIYGTSSVPTGSALATSDPIDVTTIGAGWAIFTFTFSTPYTTVNNTYYCVSCEYDGGDASNYIQVGFDSTSPTHPGNAFNYISSWAAYPAYDCIFYCINNYGGPYFLVNDDISAGVLELADVAPRYTLAKDSSQGWNVNKKASPNYCIYYPDATIGRTDAKWVTTEPSAFSQYGYRTAATLNGTFANANWVLYFKVVNDATYYAQTGYVKFRLWRSVNADGSGATQITPGWQTSSLISFTAGSQEKTGSITWSPGATVTLTNEYLFLEIEWSCAVSGGNNSAYVYWVHNEGEVEQLTTPNLSVEYSESISLAGSAAVGEASGGSSIYPTLSIPATAGLSPAAILAIQSSMSLGGNAALDEGRNLQILQTASLPGSTSLDLVAGLLAEMALTLAGGGTLDADGLVESGSHQYQEILELATVASAVKTALLELLASQSLEGVGGLSVAAIIQATAGALLSASGALMPDHILGRLGAVQFDGSAGISLGTLLQALDDLLLTGSTALTPAALNAALGLLSLAVTASLTTSGRFDAFKEIYLAAAAELTATLIYEMGAQLGLACLASLTLQSSLTGNNLISLAVAGQMQELAQIVLTQVVALAGIAGQETAMALGVNGPVSLPAVGSLGVAAERGLMLSCSLGGITSLATVRQLDCAGFLLLESVSAFVPFFGPRVVRGYRLDLILDELNLDLKLD